MTVVFIGAVILALWVMYDSGNLMSEKIKLQNTADNVAYSTANLVTRDLNFIAYTNRGMVANQVAIAQFVGMSSWIHMMEQALRNISDIARLIPGAAAPIEAMQRGVRATVIGFDQAAGFMVGTIDRFVVPALSVAQGAYHYATFVAVPSYSREIAGLNDEKVRPAFGDEFDYGGAAMTAADLLNKIGLQNKLHSVAQPSKPQGKEIGRFRELERIVEDSRDAFSAERSYKWADFSLGVGLGRAFSVEFQLRKYGGSDFLRKVAANGKYKWSWTAMDTVGVWVRVCGIFKCGKWYGDAPLGWGAAHALSNDRRPSPFFGYGSHARSAGRWGNGAYRNPNAGKLAAIDDGDRNLAFIGNGTPTARSYSESTLRPFFAFREDGAPENQVDFGPVVYAVYRKSADHIGSQKTLIEGSGGTVAEVLDTQSEGSLPNNEIYAASKARPYFTRATDLSRFARLDRRYEHGNLYNPFWHTRLVEVTDVERGVISGAVTAINF